MLSYKFIVFYYLFKCIVFYEVFINILKMCLHFSFSVCVRLNRSAQDV